MRTSGISVRSETAPLSSLPAEMTGLRGGGASHSPGSATAMQIVATPSTSCRTAPGEAALEQNSPVQMGAVSGNRSGAIGVMTVGTTATRGAAHTHPAMTISSPVRTGDASQSSLSVMRTTIVEMGQMNRSTCATPQNPRAPLISFAVITGTASTWERSVTTWTIARTTVTRKDAALMSARILQSVAVTTTVQTP